ncbi:MAG: hypothetical protein EA355_00440 [Rhodobacteraceae bacterium]|nr:MAG: hypothetical protein EA355_00440 [Paracoccaceae bacterium]
MSDYPSAIVSALISALLASFAPALRAADAVCSRVAGNPGLFVAQREIAAWLHDLRLCDHGGALEPNRLEAVLRALLVRAISRGSVEIGGHPDHGGPVLLLAAEDLAVLEIVREIAVILDDTNGTAIAATFDAHRETMIDKVFAMASAADRAQR